MTTTLERTQIHAIPDSVNLAERPRGAAPFPVPAAEAFRDPTWEPPPNVDGDDLERLWPLVDFLVALDLARVGNRLIQANAALHHLRDRKVAYRWKREGGATGGKPTLGKCQKPSGLLKHFAGVDVVVWLAADHARELGPMGGPATYRQVEAALLHELLHTAEHPETGKLVLVGYDFVGFVQEIRQYGEWHRDLRVAGAAFRQLRLELELELDGLDGDDRAE